MILELGSYTKDLSLFVLILKKDKKKLYNPIEMILGHVSIYSRCTTCLIYYHDLQKVQNETQKLSSAQTC